MTKIFKAEHGTDLYNKALALRYEVLRKPINMQFSEAEMKHDEKMTYFLYMDNNEALGVVGLEFLTPTKGQLRQMAVHDKAQGSGLGRELVTHLENYSRAAGLVEIHLDARYPARGFYAKLGYTEYGEIYDKIGMKHIDMKKEL